MQEYVEHRERCWWQYRNRKLQDAALIDMFDTEEDGTVINFRTDFSARESYEQQDAATGQKPNVGSVCISIVQHSPSRRKVTTYTKEVIDEDDAKGFARKVVTYAKGEHTTEEKVVLTTDVHFAYARNKGNARFHHTFHQDIISLYKTGKVKHAFAAWYEGKVLPGCKNYEHEEGDKWTEATFEAWLPKLLKALGFTDGAGPQYQCRETTHGTARCHADLGVIIVHDVHERYDFKGPWDSYGKESTESRRAAVRNRTATINNAYKHAKHNASAMARPKQVCRLLAPARSRCPPTHSHSRCCAHARLCALAADAGEGRGALARLRGRPLLPLLLPLRGGRGGQAARRRPQQGRPARARRRGRQGPHRVQALRGRPHDERRRQGDGLRLCAQPPRLLLRAEGGRELQPRRLDGRRRPGGRGAREARRRRRRRRAARDAAGEEAERPVGGLPSGHRRVVAAVHAGRLGRRDGRRREHLVARCMQAAHACTCACTCRMRMHVHPHGTCTVRARAGS